MRKEVKTLAKMVFQVLLGSENLTRACFPFLLAVAQKEHGDEVAISLAAEGGRAHSGCSDQFAHTLGLAAP